MSGRPSLNPGFCHLLALRSWPNHLISLHLSSLLCYVYPRGVLWELNEMMQVKYSVQDLKPQKQSITIHYRDHYQIEGPDGSLSYLYLCLGSSWGHVRQMNVSIDYLAEQWTWEMNWVNLPGNCLSPCSENGRLTRCSGAGFEGWLGDVVPRQPQEELDSGVQDWLSWDVSSGKGPLTSSPQPSTSQRQMQGPRQMKRTAPRPHSLSPVLMHLLILIIQTGATKIIKRREST